MGLFQKLFGSKEVTVHVLDENGKVVDVRDMTTSQRERHSLFQALERYQSSMLDETFDMMNKTLNEKQKNKTSKSKSAQTQAEKPQSKGWLGKVETLAPLANADHGANSDGSSKSKQDTTTIWHKPEGHNDEGWWGGCNG